MCVIAPIALAVLIESKISPAWVVLGGGLAGLALSAIRQEIRFLFASGVDLC
jgi:hypothetical protein